MPGKHGHGGLIVKGVVEDAMRGGSCCAMQCVPICTLLVVYLSLETACLASAKFIEKAQEYSEVFLKQVGCFLVKYQKA